MRISKLSAFTAYELSEEEMLQGYDFTEANRAVIQNLISANAEELLIVRLDGKMQSEEERVKAAFTSGQIAILRYLLSTGEELKAAERQAKLDREAPENKL